MLRKGFTFFFIVNRLYYVIYDHIYIYIYIIDRGAPAGARQPPHFSQHLKPKETPSNFEEL